MRDGTARFLQLYIMPSGNKSADFLQIVSGMAEQTACISLPEKREYIRLYFMCHYPKDAGTWNKEYLNYQGRQHLPSSLFY